MALDKGTRGQAPARRKPKPRQKPRPRPPVYEAPGSSSQVRNARGARQYPFLRFNEGVDWRNVKPQLLVALNSIARSRGQPLVVTSGFRSHAHQRKLYYELKAQNANAVVAPPGSSRHEFGDAVDAGFLGADGSFVPIGNVVSDAEFAAHGLRDLSNINDAVHVELSERSATPPAAAGAPAPAMASVPSGAPMPAGMAMPTAGAPMAPSPESADILPHELEEPDLPILEPQQLAETWQLITSMPGVSEETRRFARRAGF